MSRYAALLACCLFCPFAHSHPAPQRETPPSNEELIIGLWEQKDYGVSADPPVFWEFRKDGTFRRFSSPGSGEPDNCSFSIVDNRIQINVDDHFGPRIETLTNKKMILRTFLGGKCEFSKR
jgi:hypothetical protein